MASGNTLLVFAYDPQRGESIFISHLNVVYCSLARITSIPKILLVSVTNKAQVSYRKIFDFLLKPARIVDVDILEISSKVAKKNKRKAPKSNDHHFTVHQYNPFSRIYRKSKLTRAMRWFEPKLMNLHGHKILTNPCLSEDSIFYLNGENVRFKLPTLYENSKLGVTFRSLMNFTYRNTSSGNEDIRFSEVFLEPYRYDVATLKPSLFAFLYVYTPVINDTSVEVNVLNFLIFFPLMLAIALLLKLTSKLSGFVPQTWSILAIFRMLLGLDNPTGRMSSILESAFFILISFTGIFYSNEFSEAATSILNPIKLERHFNSFPDVRASNLTICLHENLISYHRHYGRIENLIRTAKVNITIQDDFIFYEVAKMLSSNGIAVSKPENPGFVPIFRGDIQADGVTLARKCGLTENKWIASLRVQQYSPYVERMSELYWRFYKSGFYNLDEPKFIHKIEKHIIMQYHLRKSQRPADNNLENDADFFSYILLLILLIGSALAVIALAVEILIHKIVSRHAEQPKVAREEFEVNFRIGTPIFISKESLDNATDIEFVDEDDSDTSMEFIEETNFDSSTPVTVRRYISTPTSETTTRVLVHAIE